MLRVNECLPIVGAILDQLCERLFDDSESAICASDSIPKHLAGTHLQTCEEYYELESNTYHADDYASLSL